MEKETKITVLHGIKKNPELAKNLKRGSKTLSASIQEFATITGLTPIFIEQNINRIQNWID